MFYSCSWQRLKIVALAAAAAAAPAAAAATAAIAASTARNASAARSAVVVVVVVVAALGGAAAATVSGVRYYVDVAAVEGLLELLLLLLPPPLSLLGCSVRDYIRRIKKLVQFLKPGRGQRTDGDGDGGDLEQGLHGSLDLGGRQGLRLPRQRSCFVPLSTIAVTTVESSSSLPEESSSCVQLDLLQKYKLLCKRVLVGLRQRPTRRRRG